MRLYFAEGYHGGAVAMGRWGEKGFHQCPLWEFGTYVPRWLREHLFRRIDTFPEYKAALEIEAVTFEYWEQHDPELVDEIRQRIELGQLEIVDGTYSQPYGHVLGHESIARQFLYGQEILERLTGSRATTLSCQEHMFVPNMPGLLVAGGVRAVILRAHIHHFGCCPAIDEEFVHWRGPDGKTIPAIPNYFTDRYPYGFEEETLIECEQLAAARGVKRMLFSQGLDVSHDQDFIAAVLKGGPDAEPYDVNERLWHDEFLLSDWWPPMGISDKKLRMLYERGYTPILPSTFVDGYGPEQGKPYDFDADYFHYAFLFGAFGDAAVVAIKRAEASLYAAEITDVFLKLSGFEGDERDSAALEQAWKQVLEAQAHDIHVALTSFSLAVTDFPVRMAENWCRDAAKSAESIAARNCRALIQQHVTEPAAEPHIVLFNPLSFRRTDAATVSVELPQGFARGLRLFGESGEVPFDCLRCRRFPDGSICAADLILPVDIPGTGFQVLDIEPAADLPEPERVSTDTVNTGCIEATVADGGTLAALKLVDDGYEMLASDAFQGNELTADFLEGFVRTSDRPAAGECSRGRYLTELKTETWLGKMPVSVRLRFYQNSARIDFHTEIDFDKDTSTKQSDETGEFYMEWDNVGAVRVHFNPSFPGEFFTDFPLSVERSSRQTIPGQSFGCLTNGDVGMTLINCGNIGYCRTPGKDIGLSLILASGNSAYRYGPYPLSGEIAFDYSLIPHRGDWVTAGSVLRAAEVRTPVHAATVCGRLAPDVRQPFMQIADERVLATTLFQRKGVVFLRLWNSLPEPVETEVTCRFPLQDVRATDIFGENNQAVAVTKDRFKVSLAPFELTTLVLREDG